MALFQPLRSIVHKTSYLNLDNYYILYSQAKKSFINNKDVFHHYFLQVFLIVCDLLSGNIVKPIQNRISPYFSFQRLIKTHNKRQVPPVFYVRLGYLVYTSFEMIKKRKKERKINVISVKGYSNNA